MINIFEKHAPEYRRIVRKYALDVWHGRAGKKNFLRKVELFKRKYHADLIKHYQDKGIKIYRGTIDAKANQWQVDQLALAESIKVIAAAKKNKLIAQQFDELRKTKPADVQKMLNKIYLTSDAIASGESVYKVFSFKENFEARAMQLGEESAFDLGSEINHAVLIESGDRYEWNTQQDKRVRDTHKKLNGKVFLYSDHPTTIDKYGKRHTGPPGTDYGCRCFESQARKKGKVWKNYVVDMSNKNK